MSQMLEVGTMIMTIICHQPDNYVNKSIAQELKPIIVGDITMPPAFAQSFDGKIIPDQLIITYNEEDNKINVAIRSPTQNCVFDILEANNITVKRKTQASFP